VAAIFPTIKFRAFRAIDENITCRRYIDGHVKVLIDYGIANVTSGKTSWTSNPSVYGIVAEREDGTMLGGIRVQLANGIYPLPVEDAVGDADPKIHELVRKYSSQGVGELCGLWNSREVAGMGISVLLVRAGISIINQLNFNILIGICGDYTLEMFTRVGFVVDRSLGTQGQFVYPNEKYIARVLGILNAATMETAEPVERNLILGLRENPLQRKEERGPKGSVTIDYNLVVPR
jgi:hypothetical protein